MLGLLNSVRTGAAGVATSILQRLWLAYADGIVWDDAVSGNVSWEDSTY